MDIYDYLETLENLHEEDDTDTSDNIRDLELEIA